MKTPPPESQPFDLETEWPEARWFDRGVGDERESLWVFPVLLLYTGFFFGPFVTVLAAIFAMRGRIGLRQAGILTGVAGTCWCLMQGLSVVYGPLWSEYALQGMRSGLNFANGITAYVLVRRAVLPELRVTRTTVLASTIFVIVAAAVFIFTPGRVLIALGR